MFGISLNLSLDAMDLLVLVRTAILS